jgi:hypothetical protein
MILYRFCKGFLLSIIFTTPTRVAAPAAIEPA